LLFWGKCYTVLIAARPLLTRPKLLAHGRLIPDSIIRFKFPHLRRDIGETIQFEVAQERLE